MLISRAIQRLELRCRMRHVDIAKISSIIAPWMKKASYRRGSSNLQSNSKSTLTMAVSEAVVMRTNDLDASGDAVTRVDLKNRRPTGAVGAMRYFDTRCTTHHDPRTSAIPNSVVQLVSVPSRSAILHLRTNAGPGSTLCFSDCLVMRTR